MLHQSHEPPHHNATNVSKAIISKNNNNNNNNIKLCNISYMLSRTHVCNPIQLSWINSYFSEYCSAGVDSVLLSFLRWKLYWTAVLVEELVTWRAESMQPQRNESWSLVWIKENPIRVNWKRSGLVSVLLWHVDSGIERVFRKSGWMLDSWVGGTLVVGLHSVTTNFSRAVVKVDGGVILRGSRGVCGSVGCGINCVECSS